MAMTPISQNHFNVQDCMSKEAKTEGKKKLEMWLNKSMKILMTDGRTLIGMDGYVDYIQDFCSQK